MGSERAGYAVIDESTNDGATWTHNPCGTVLLGAPVYHPVHDGPFPLSGSGEVRTETVPYCPNCQEKPSPNGAPIKVPWRG